jgi:hypothetical protein
MVWRKPKKKRVWNFDLTEQLIDINISKSIGISSKAIEKTYNFDLQARHSIIVQFIFE